MLLYRYAATGSAPSRLDPDMHEMQSAGSTASLAAASLQHSQLPGTQRPSPSGGELHPSHTSVDVEGESRLGDIAAVQRGNGHAQGGLSVSGNLTASLASNETEIEHSPADRGYGNKDQFVAEHTRPREDVYRHERPVFLSVMQDMKFC